MKRPAVWLILLLVLSGCATTRQFVPFPDRVMDVSHPDKGRIYVMRPERMFGGALSFDILDEDALIGELGAGGFVSWEREPGQARILSRENGNTAAVDIQVERGNAYYVLQKIHMMGRHSLDLVDSDRGRALVKKCKSADLPVGDANKIREKRDSVVRFYDDDWRRVWAVNVLYGFQKAWLFQLQHEVALSHSTYGSSGLQFGAGVFQTAESASVRVQDSNGVERRGRFNVNAIPISVNLFQYKKIGFLSGKWGIGGSVFPFDGDIDMNDGTDPYKADGVGFNLFLPFEGIVTVGQGKTIFRLDGMIQMPTKKQSFENSFGKVTGVAPYSGLFLGVSVARKF